MALDIGGIDNTEARETLRQTIESGSISGIQAIFHTPPATRHDEGCPVIWSGMTGLADFDRELSGGVEMVYADVCLPPETFLRLQMGANLVRGFDPAVDVWLSEPLRKSSLPEMVRILEAGERDLPTPLIELDRQGRLRGFQEGRTRAVAAHYADIDQMPLYVFLNTRKRDGGMGLDPPSEFNIAGHLDANEPDWPDPVDAQALANRSQQYRGYEPIEFIDAVETTPGDDAEVDKKLRQALNTVESARLTPFLEATSAMFSRLDRDERELFTRRNPVHVQWMSAYNTISDHNPYQEFYDLAESLLTELPLAKRTGMEQRSARVMRADVDVPPFERPDYGVESMLDSMLYRRRSYRNWSPFEFLELAEREGISITRGRAGELDLYDAETREEIEDWPIEEDGKVIARALLERPESGRLKPMLRAGHKFITPLDPDEMEEFVKQNPGIFVWISAWGFTEDLLWGPQLLRSVGSVEFPPLGEVSMGESP